MCRPARDPSPRLWPLAPFSRTVLMAAGVDPAAVRPGEAGALPDPGEDRPTDPAVPTLRPRASPCERCCLFKLHSQCGNIFLLAFLQFMKQKGHKDMCPPPQSSHLGAAARWPPPCTGEDVIAADEGPGSQGPHLYVDSPNASIDREQLLGDWVFGACGEVLLWAQYCSLPQQASHW